MIANERTTNDDMCRRLDVHDHVSCVRAHLPDLTYVRADEVQVVTRPSDLGGEG